MRMFASVVEPIVTKYAMMQRTTLKMVKLVKQFEMSNWNELSLNRNTLCILNTRNMSIMFRRLFQSVFHKALMEMLLQILSKAVIR